MLKTRLALAATLAGLVTVFTASAALAYPDPVLEPAGGSAADGVVAPGEEFNLTGGFDGVDCNPWVATFLGEPIGSGSGTTFSVSATAPEEEGTYNLNITCTYDDGTEPTVEPTSFSSAALPSVIQTTTLSFPIEVTTGAGAGDGAGDGAGSGSEDGVLPDTGGSNLWLLAGGAALVIAGGGLVVARRRNA